MENMASSWTWQLITRHHAVISRASAYAHDDSRMKVSKTIASPHVRNLEHHINDIPTEPILNVDDIGFSPITGSGD
jgi:hypothetical protein